MSAFSNVLLIEDNPGDARLVASYLNEGLGERCAVRQAGTLAAGLTALRQDAADVVLLDLGLPDSQGMAGYIEVSRLAPHTPVVILTGRDDEHGGIDALRMGAEDYLAKHKVDGPSLVRALRHAVQRRRMTESLRQSESRYRAIVETAEEGILQLDRDGTVRYLNARACQILDLANVDPAQLLGLRGWVSVSAQGVVEELLATPEGRRVSRELRLLGGPAGGRWAIAAAGGIAEQAGVPSQIVLLLTDITERRRTEGELARMRTHLEVMVAERTVMLELANEELRALGRAMAHDLRTPLSGIIGMTQLVEMEARDVLPTAARKRLLMVEQCAREMNELIDRLLSLAALGRQELQRTGLDLSAMAETVARRLEAAEQGRRVRWRIQPGLTAQGDRALVANVLQNLIENAWKYSSRVPDASIEFGVNVDAQMIPVYYVRDNGVGFDMAQAAQLFQAFERLPSAQDYAGTGLGLAGVKRIVARHGGTAWADSTPGLGSTFYFTLEAPAATN